MSWKILLARRFKCNLPWFIWVCFILFAWSINEKFLSLHSLAKCAFTFFALLWKWLFQGIILEMVTSWFSLLKVMAISVIDFAVNSCDWPESRSFAPTCSMKWSEFCLTDGFAWSFRHRTFTPEKLLTFHFFNFLAISQSYYLYCFIILSLGIMTVLSLSVRWIFVF